VLHSQTLYSKYDWNFSVNSCKKKLKKVCKLFKILASNSRQQMQFHATYPLFDSQSDCEFSFSYGIPHKIPLFKSQSDSKFTPIRFFLLFSNIIVSKNIRPHHKGQHLKSSCIFIFSIKCLSDAAIMAIIIYGLALIWTGENCESTMWSEHTGYDPMHPRYFFSNSTANIRQYNSFIGNCPSDPKWGHW